jgi:hypothetical protein
MRTGPHLQAQLTGRPEADFTWFSLGASLPLVSMDPERAAHQIVEAMRQRQAEVIVTPPAGRCRARIWGPHSTSRYSIASPHAAARRFNERPHE